MRIGHEKVVTAWREGKKRTVGPFSTDGYILKSYAHVIGKTDEDGAKVALDCHYSRTTKMHSKAACIVSDIVVPCVH